MSSTSSQADIRASSPRPRHRFRPESEPLKKSLFPPEETNEDGRAETVTPYRARLHSVDSMIDSEEGKLQEVQKLRDEWSRRSDRLCSRPLHLKGVRENLMIHDFVDLVREYDEIIFRLSFDQLTEPGKHSWTGSTALPLSTSPRLRPGDYAPLISSLRHANMIVTNAGWRIRRYIDLWETHLKNKAFRDETWGYMALLTAEKAESAAEQERCRVF
ncbi:hypothetical protein GGS23DRAFT_224770 [Durotheca rogersii]|uniref:uncharacterized protein n=1 Tax=Durotheca rogersii TaxID=419775 RepID=UPI00221EC26E|nr:uncharacterized protein GGS23DRAFT_224770 [Durotheca rogersii]KAI5860476.1 hypothetical protein GGS23DRAFT_224770 [Durotheca rogersii]